MPLHSRGMVFNCSFRPGVHWAEGRLFCNHHVALQYRHCGSWCRKAGWCAGQGGHDFGPPGPDGAQSAPQLSWQAGGVPETCHHPAGSHHGSASRWGLEHTLLWLCDRLRSAVQYAGRRCLPANQSAQARPRRRVAALAVGCQVWSSSGLHPGARLLAVHVHDKPGLEWTLSASTYRQHAQTYQTPWPVNHPWGCLACTCFAVCWQAGQAMIRDLLQHRDAACRRSCLTARPPAGPVA